MGPHTKQLACAGRLIAWPWLSVRSAGPWGNYPDDRADLPSVRGLRRTFAVCAQQAPTPADTLLVEAANLG